MKSSVSLTFLGALLVQAYALPATSVDEVARRTSVASTQYHATCAAHSEEIQSDIKSEKLSLLPDSERRWPDEFTWSGGFYLTPDRDNAVAFGASFLSYCVGQNKGGVVIMEFSLDTSNLGVAPLSPADGQTENQNFFNQQSMLGTAIRNYLCAKKGLPNDDNCEVDPPDQEQIADIRQDTSSSSLQATYMTYP
ncbi:hypothetical protein B0H11DRAFT_1934903 [Mycena galericulata]|nr:hypothetical protein B0H11DRAFT_1934903 [Mycena galericulata]